MAVAGAPSVVVIALLSSIADMLGVRRVRERSYLGIARSVRTAFVDTRDDAQVREDAFGRDRCI
jgi:hypothetical protein